MPEITVTRAMKRVMRAILGSEKWMASEDTIQPLVDGEFIVYIDWKGWEVTPKGMEALRDKRVREVQAAVILSEVTDEAAQV